MSDLPSEPLEPVDDGPPTEEVPATEEWPAPAPDPEREPSHDPVGDGVEVADDA